MDGQHRPGRPLLRRRPADQPRGPRRARARAAGPVPPAGVERARLPHRRPDSHTGSVGRSAMTFHLPDTLTALPLRPFEFSPAAHDAVTTTLAQEPAAL